MGRKPNIEADRLRILLHECEQRCASLQAEIAELQEAMHERADCIKRREAMIDRLKAALRAQENR
jgi:Arc/MetJ-type ribon-helix-helix transcriptional regulator